MGFRPSRAPASFGHTPKAFTLTGLSHHDVPRIEIS